MTSNHEHRNGEDAFPSGPLAQARPWDALVARARAITGNCEVMLAFRLEDGNWHVEAGDDNAAAHQALVDHLNASSGEFVISDDVAASRASTNPVSIRPTQGTPELEIVHVVAGSSHIVGAVAERKHKDTLSPCQQLVDAAEGMAREFYDIARGLPVVDSASRRKRRGSLVRRTATGSENNMASSLESLSRTSSGLHALHNAEPADVTVVSVPPESASGDSEMAMLERVASDMHDGVIPVVVGARLKLEALRMKAPEALRKELAQISTMLGDAATRARAIAHGFALFEFGHTERDDCLAIMAKQTSSVFGIPCDADGIGCPPCDAKTREQLCLIVLEAIHNAVRHSKPTHIWLRTEMLGGDFALSVENDGYVARKPGDKIDTSGIGLKSMSRRAAQLGGMLETYTHDDRFIVAVTLFGPENS